MHIFFPCIVFVCVLCSVSCSVIDREETDRLALLSFKEHITLDPNQTMRSWNDSTHFCNWTGIVCGQKHKRVVVLNLWSWGLSGSISPAIGNLSFLRVFLFHNNHFTGNLPQEVGRLSKLRRLGLNQNSLTGKIPLNLSRCLNLVELDIGGNNFTGIFPKEFESLTKLKSIILDKNNLAGQIPKFIGNFTSLKQISAKACNYYGSIPDTLGQLSNLTFFGFPLNMLSGVLPSSFFNLSSLTMINLPQNLIDGNLPTDFAQRFPRLRFLYLSINKFTGPIPVSLSNASNLEELALGDNLFTGTVPSFDRQTRLTWFAIGSNKLGNGKADNLNFVSSLGNCTNLTFLGFGANNLGGVLPKSLFNFTQLTQLIVTGSLISGNIPSEIGQLVNINRLVLSNNLFMGRVPESIGNLRNLGQLSLHDNSLSGSIPFSLGNLTLLSQLGLGYNNFQGNVPYTISNCRQLQLLLLNHNNLSGEIPKEIFSLSSLISLDLSNNHFVGSLPSEVDNLKNLVYFNISNNMMSGVIPPSLGGCTSLVALSISGNTIQGEIPVTFSSLRGLSRIDLSCNNLTGKIPEYLGDFKSLRTLNLSFNSFKGTLPVLGAFKNTTIVSINGNVNLCGGFQEFQLPECTFPHPLKNIIPVVSVLFLLIMAITFYLVYKRKNSKKASLETDSDIKSLPQVSYRNLQKATNGFSSENLIGSGKFSSVYKAVLSQKDGPQVVAVKVLKLAVYGAHKAFTAEGEALRKIRHKNLVRIITSCSGTDLQGNDFKALIYDYMVNGSLEDWLHQNPVVGPEIEETTRCLNFFQRLNIVIDVARALDYIHFQCGSPMIHCDIKPCNILLNADLVAHLGDFGLARFLQYASDDFSASNTSSLGVLGTVGYVAPEYGMGGQASTYGDIYSFGILLLETFTRKRPTHEMFNNGLSLRDFVKMAIPDHVLEITDPVLLETRQEENERTRAYRSIKESLTTIYQIGITCSMETPRDRIDMNNVFNQLESVKKTFVGGRRNLI
uniref:probable LRR receptor-like serine/threonine-protein kinase At3g47570 n=1 Tax=Erigeron canadensis TaxID=72917 RepID=UPI001CB932B4|nr:probable LRR receptor-like serine/threonine-protein kinase At3g47570 [Erigeron canadensis]